MMANVDLGDDHGIQNEEELALVLEGCYLKDFVVRGATFLLPSGKALEGADFLLPLHDRIIVLQVRSGRFDPHFDPLDQVQAGRVNSRIAKAVTQIKTIKRGLKSATSSSVPNLRGIELKFDWPQQLPIQGVVVYRAGSASALKPCAIPDVGAQLREVRGIPIHVFERSEFECVVGDYDTVPDLVEFLDIREKLLRSGQLVSPFQDSDLSAMVQARRDTIDAALSDGTTMLCIAPHFREDLAAARPAEHAHRARRHNSSKLFDKFIDLLHESIGYDPSQEGSEGADLLAELGSTPGTVGNYQEIAWELGLFPRHARMALGEGMLGAARRSDSSPTGFSFHLQAAVRHHPAVLFVATCGKDRRQNRNGLYRIAAAASVRLGGAPIIAIGGQNYSARDGALDYLYLKSVRFQNADELRQYAALIFGPEKRIRTSLWETTPRPSAEGN